jgi:hypothetical protein
VGTAIHYHLANHFNFPIIHCRCKNIGCHCVTVSQGIILKRILLREEYAPDNLIPRTVAGKPLYIGNREMSDKLRNRF